MGIDGIGGNGQVSWSSFLNAVEDASKAGKLGDVVDVDFHYRSPSVYIYWFIKLFIKRKKSFRFKHI